MDMIQCGGCGKKLLVARFSDTGIKKYQESLTKKKRNPRETIKYPRCQNCNPQNRQEMKCTKCNLVKGLDDFSKAQRSQTDTAECKDCVQEREDRLANHEDAVAEEEIIEDMKRLVQSQYIPSNASRLQSAMPSKASGQSDSDKYETETNPGSESWVRGNDAISVGSGYTTETIASRRPQTGTAWDQFEGDNRVRGPASLASRERFAKQNAVPKSQMQRAQEQIERDRTRQRLEDAKLRSADSDEGSDDDDEDPY